MAIWPEVLLYRPLIIIFHKDEVMDFWNLLASIFVGCFGYFSVQFIIAPILEFRNLRREIHQKLIEYANIWQTPKSVEGFDYFILVRNLEAANCYRRLSAQLTAFTENLKSEKLYCLTQPWLLNNYDLTSASGALMTLEADVNRPDKDFRTAQVNKVKKALRIDSN